MHPPEAAVGGMAGDGDTVAGRAFEAMAQLASTAASVLETQLAIGITAATLAERWFLDVDELRSEAPDGLVPRFRRDAHDALDTLMDVVSVAARSLGGRAGELVRVTSRSQPSGDRRARVAVIRVPGPLAPGQTGECVVLVTNDGARPTGRLSLASADLAGESGLHIPGRQVYFEPSTISLAPGESVKLVVGVTVPPGAAVGRYEGALEGPLVGGHPPVLRVDVAA